MEKRNFSDVKIINYVIEDSFKSILLHIVLFDEKEFGVAKEFWQHTGLGISSRFAEYCLYKLNLLFTGQFVPTHLTKQHRQASRDHFVTVDKASSKGEMNNWVEERFGRNLPQCQVSESKVRLRKRIAGVLGDSLDDDRADSEMESVRLCEGVQETNVRLFSCGMASIYFAHQAVIGLRPGLKTVQFGYSQLTSFPYLDTLKIQQKFGTGCLFLGYGNEEDLNKLENFLQREKIAALFCEFPSNPLLKSPQLKRLWDLANQYDFYLIVDETIGNFVNIHVLPFCDMIVSSLTKVFSGDSNVMGGSIVTNPNSSRFQDLAAWINTNYQDCLWDQDAIFLERNSRKFQSRIKKINKNAELLCDQLKSHPRVKEIYYPKYTTREHYEQVLSADGGYGGLFSIVLHDAQDAPKFYDSLAICKGPSLGTNFTLCCPYTLIAHYNELDWAESFGVSRHLIRVSVGLEDPEWLVKEFLSCLNKL